MFKEEGRTIAQCVYQHQPELLHMQPHSQISSIFRAIASGLVGPSLPGSLFSLENFAID